ncbi:MAG: HAMP domain-containing protein [Gammaproteobacteria bacterium]|nr:HAMP domain-containing protein [Gammaproteobacteria bacterium]
MFGFYKRKIGVRYVLATTLLIAAIIFVVSWTVGSQVDRLAEQNAKTVAKETAYHYTNIIKSELAAALHEAEVIADVFESAANVEGFRLTRRKANMILKYLIENRPRFLGIFLAFEPDAFDGKDARFSGEYGHDETGRFIPHWSRDDKGEGVLEPLTGYTEEGLGDYYLRPKKHLRKSITEPGLYPLRGKDVQVTSLTAPILDKQRKFIGIAGIHLALEVLQPLAGDIKIEGFEDAYVHFFSPDGLVITSSNSAYYGKRVEDVTNSPDFIENVRKNKEFLMTRSSGTLGGKTVITYGVPAKIGATDKQWIITVNVPKEVLTARAEEVITLIVNIGIAAILVAIFIMYFLTARGIVRPLRKAVGLSSLLTAGNLAARVEVHNAEDEIGQLLTAMNDMADRHQKIIQEVSTEFGKLADGDMRARITEEFTGDFSEIKQAANEMAEKLQAVIGEAPKMLEQLSNGNLSARSKSNFTGDFAKINNAANETAANLQMLIGETCEVLGMLSMGNMTARIAGNFPGDFAEIKRATNIMAKDFYSVIGETSKTLAQLSGGKLDIRIHSEFAGDFGELRNALESTARQLMEATRQNVTETWLKTGQMELNECMSGEQDIVHLAENIINIIVPWLEAQIGAFYVQEETGKEAACLRMIASYAFVRRKNLANRFVLGDGVPGQAALEQKIIIISEMPDDHIYTGSGKSAPYTILAVPFLYEGILKGVIEIASVNDFPPVQLDFLEQVMPSIGIAVNSAQSRAKMQKLLQQSQTQAEELQSQQHSLQKVNEQLRKQQGELQSQAEELQAREEELRQSNEELRERTEALEHQQKEIHDKNRELEKSQAAIKAKAKEVELASKYKSEFFANMSHELRTPLNSLLILARLLADNKENTLTEKQIKWARTIYSAGSDLLALINDILDLSKMEAGKIEVHPGDLLLSDVVASLEEKFRHIAEEKKVSFDITLADELPGRLHTDSQRLIQIINNLLSNAFKFTSKGGVRLDILPASPDKNLSGSDLNSAIAFSVSDSGIGIPPAKQKGIFEVFQQADGTTSRRYGGTGLGLSISRRLAQLLGGEIQLHSEAGKGSTFTLYLPEKIVNC